MKTRSEIRTKLINLYQAQREYDSYERGIEIETLEWVLKIIKGNDASHTKGEKE